ncbi:hypothetical protein AALA80_16875 [Oscillospiraceae bacterium 50-60]
MKKMYYHYPGFLWILQVIFQTKTLSPSRKALSLFDRKHKNGQKPRRGETQRGQPAENAFGKLDGISRTFRLRPCLKNGGMPNGERYFRQLRQIFAGGLTPGKKILRRVADKDPPFGRFDFFQTWPKSAPIRPCLINGGMPD